MKGSSVLRTLRFIFFTVVLFVLVLSAVMVTILNIYKPMYRAKINDNIVGYFKTEAEFDEIFKVIADEKKVDGLDVKVYLDSDPEFELSYIRKNKLEEQNLYTEVREIAKTEYTVYNVMVKDKTEMTFSSKESAEAYVTDLKKNTKGVEIAVKAEKIAEINSLTDTAKAKEIYTNLVSRYKPEEKKVVRKKVTQKTTASAKYNGTSTAVSTNASVSGGIKPASGTYTQYYKSSHRGIDIASKSGTPIYAYKAGKVIYAKWQASYGYLVKIDHGDGVITYYAHLSAFNVKEGNSVVAGQKIAEMGSTGWSTGPHLHFEIRVNNVPINPYPYIK
ncbi:MAG: M23 family metallopeptidase [Clostridia bacterium]|nr:M23 family metallopeptidase [Clostridia bacterium]MDD4376014.1 M23 family metallopeptidase [Clostridia bacterium]